MLVYLCMLYVHITTRPLRYMWLAEEDKWISNSGSFFTLSVPSGLPILLHPWIYFEFGQWWWKIPYIDVKPPIVYVPSLRGVCWPPLHLVLISQCEELGVGVLDLNMVMLVQFLLESLYCWDVICVQMFYLGISWIKGDIVFKRSLTYQHALSCGLLNCDHSFIFWKTRYDLWISFLHLPQKVWHIDDVGRTTYLCI